MLKLSKIVVIERIALGVNVEGGCADLPQCFANIARIGLAGSRQVDRVVHTRKKCDLELLLQALDVPADGARGEAESRAARVTLPVLAAASKAASLAVDGRNRRDVCIFAPNDDSRLATMIALKSRRCTFKEVSMPPPIVYLFRWLGTRRSCLNGGDTSYAGRIRCEAIRYPRPFEH